MLCEALLKHYFLHSRPTSEKKKKNSFKTVPAYYQIQCVFLLAINVELALFHCGMRLQKHLRKQMAIYGEIRIQL